MERTGQEQTQAKGLTVAEYSAGCGRKILQQKALSEPNPKRTSKGGNRIALAGLGHIPHKAKR